MNIDFALYTPPRINYDPISLWGEVIFVPKKQESVKNKQQYSSFFNCYKANRQTEVTLSIQAARLQTYGIPFTQIQQTNSTKDSQPIEYQTKYYIPCLYLNSMVRSQYLILYFHASGEDIKLSYNLLNHLRNLYQINVIAMQYPGYSIYKGSAKSSRINEEAEYIYSYIINELGFAQQNIIIMGRSIGTGTAIHLANLKKQGALVLISSFISIKSLIKDFIGGWSSLFIQQQFDNIDKIKKIKCPIFFLHGKSDSFISHQNTIELAKCCKSSVKVQLPEKMTHSKFDYYQDLANPLREFLMNQTSMNFYHQQMNGPEIPSILFKNPLM